PIKQPRTHHSLKRLVGERQVQHRAALRYEIRVFFLRQCNHLIACINTLCVKPLVLVYLYVTPCTTRHVQHRASVYKRLNGRLLYRPAMLVVSFLVVVPRRGLVITVRDHAVVCLTLWHRSIPCRSTVPTCQTESIPQQTPASC